MTVTPEMIGTIVAVFGAVATLFGGFYVMLHRMEGRLETRFAKIEGEVTGLREEIRVVATDVVDLKVAVARLEGPQPRLLQAR